MRARRRWCSGTIQNGGSTLHFVAFLTIVAVTSSAACGEDGGGGPLDGPDAGDAGPDADSGPPLDYDCEDLPQGPFEIVALDGPVATEDLALDDQGFVYGASFVRPGIFRSPHGGQPELFAHTTSGMAGMDFLPNGHLVVADYGRNAIVRFDLEGIEHIVISGLSYPNGLTVGMDGLAYYSEHSAGRVRRVDAMTGEDEVIVEHGIIHNPNGLSFSPDYRALYVVEFSLSQHVWKVPFDEAGNPGEAELFVTVPSEILGGGAGLDGVGVDACGNVYVAPFLDNMFRIPPDGSAVNLFLTLQGKYSVPNMEWGTGVGGWDPMSLYFPNDVVLEVAVGVPGKPRPLD